LHLLLHLLLLLPHAPWRPLQASGPCQGGCPGGTSQGAIAWGRRSAQQREVLATTELPSGQPLDDGSGYARLNLYKAADGYGALRGPVVVLMDASRGGFNAFDSWNNDIGDYVAPSTGVVTQGSLVKSGTGTLQLTGRNSYTGATTVSAGSLALSAANRLDSLGTLVVSGGTLDLGGFGNTLAGVQQTGGTISNGTLTSTAAFDMQAGTTSAVLAGAVGLNKTGGGTTTLSGNNTYSGGTTLTAGTLSLESANAINSSGTISTSVGAAASSSSSAEKRCRTSGCTSSSSQRRSRASANTIRPRAARSIATPVSGA
jgi:autotransporter-associated beta strand protein